MAIRDRWLLERVATWLTLVGLIVALAIVSKRSARADSQSTTLGRYAIAASSTNLDMVYVLDTVTGDLSGYTASFVAGTGEKGYRDKVLVQRVLVSPYISSGSGK